MENTEHQKIEKFQETPKFYVKPKIITTAQMLDNLPKRSYMLIIHLNVVGIINPALQ